MAMPAPICPTPGTREATPVLTSGARLSFATLRTSMPLSFTSSTSQVTTADYTANARFAQNLSDRFLWFAATGWERNIPAGLP